MSLQFTTKVLQVFQNLVGWEEESKAGSYKAITLEYTSINKRLEGFFFLFRAWRLSSKCCCPAKSSGSPVLESILLANVYYFFSSTSSYIASCKHEILWPQINGCISCQQPCNEWVTETPCLLIAVFFSFS